MSRLKSGLAIENLAPGGTPSSLQSLAALDALPDLLERDRRETSAVRAEASFL